MNKDRIIQVLITFASIAFLYVLFIELIPATRASANPHGATSDSIHEGVLKTNFGLNEVRFIKIIELDSLPLSLDVAKEAILIFPDTLRQVSISNRQFDFYSKFNVASFFPKEQQVHTVAMIDMDSKSHSINLTQFDDGNLTFIYLIGFQKIDYFLAGDAMESIYSRAKYTILANTITEHLSFRE